MIYLNFVLVWDVRALMCGNRMRLKLKICVCVFRLYNASCEEQLPLQRGPVLCCTLDNIPLIRSVNCCTRSLFTKVSTRLQLANSHVHPAVVFFLIWYVTRNMETDFSGSGASATGSTGGNMEASEPYKRNGGETTTSTEKTARSWTDTRKITQQ